MQFHSFTTSVERNILTSVPGKKEKLPLSVTHPELAKEADGWDPKIFTAGSNARVSWICKKNHRWEAKIINRSANQTNCPVCAGHKILAGFNDLATLFPTIAIEAFDFDPSKIGKGSVKKLTWRCPAGHLYLASPNSRTNRLSGCPICSGREVLVGFNDLQSLFPNIASEADGWDPEKVSSGSNKKLKWKCTLGHNWTAHVANRTGNQTGCPFCSNRYVLPGFNDLRTSDPSVASEAYDWDPSTVTRSSDKYKQWQCSKSHIYTARIANRVNNESGCPFCSGNKIQVGFNDLKTTHPELAKQAIGWDPSDFSFGSNTIVKWKCQEGHQWKASVASRAAGMQTGCPSCSKSGFDPNKESYLYLMAQPKWEMKQIGITNDIERRLAEHKQSGWELLELRGPMDGHLTQQWETAILRMLKAKGADLSNSKIAGKFDGYSEAWSKSTFEVKSIKELMRLTEEFENGF